MSAPYVECDELHFFYLYRKKKFIFQLCSCFFDFSNILILKNVNILHFVYTKVKVKYA
jgi:hypothetical protein